MDSDIEPNENDHHIWRRGIVVSQAGDTLFVATSKYTTVLYINTPSEDNSIAKIGDHLDVKTEKRSDTRPGFINTKIYIYRQYKYRFCHLFFEKKLAHIVSQLRRREHGGIFRHNNGSIIQVLESEFIERVYDRDAIYSNNYPINQKYVIIKIKDLSIAPDSCWIVKAPVDDDYRSDAAPCQRREERRVENEAQRDIMKSEEYKFPQYHNDGRDNIATDYYKNNESYDQAYHNQNRLYRDNMETSNSNLSGRVPSGDGLYRMKDLSINENKREYREEDSNYANIPPVSTSSRPAPSVQRAATPIAETVNLEVEEKCRNLLRTLMKDSAIRKAILEHDPDVHEVLLNRLL